MATPSTNPEHITSKELLDGVVEHHLATEQTYKQKLTRLQEDNRDFSSLIREIKEKIEENEKKIIEENEKGSEKSEATLENEARLQGKEYRERLYQRFEGDEAETLRKRLLSFENKNIQLRLRLSDHERLYAQSIKEKSAMTMKNDEKDRHIKMLTDETEELRQQLELLQQQLEKEDLPHIVNMEEESNSEANQSDDQHTEKDTFRSDVASKVMQDNIAIIKSHGIDLQHFADKLLEKNIINATEKSEVTDHRCSVAERMHKLLEILKKFISAHGENFSIFLDILKNGKSDDLAKKLLDAYKAKIDDVNKQVSNHEAAVTKWLKEGEVDITVTRINMHGPPGSGKTCSQLLLLNQDPPAVAVTDSTRIACRAVKATRTFVGDGCLEEVDGNALLVRLASHLEAHKKDKSVVQHAGNTAVSLQDTSMGHSGTSVEASSLDTSAGDSPDENETTTERDPDVKEVCGKIIFAIQEGNAKSLKLDHHLVYIVDSGGQPACQELLPLFTRAASFNIITIDLSKGVDEKLEYQYRICEQSFPCDQNSTFTNRKFLTDTLSSAAIHSTPLVSEDATENVQCPNYLVLGTHKDIAPQNNKDALNKVLSSLNDSTSKEKDYNLILAEKEEIIYPINTLLEKGLARDDAAENLCNIILRNSAKEKIPVPIRLFAFELVLENKAAKKGCVLEIDEAMAAGRSLEMKEDDTIKALQYLHNCTIILYYHEILPKIVFTDPQPILDLLTRLLALTYKIEPNYLSYITKKSAELLQSKDELDNLEINGIFKESLLSKLRNDEDQKFKNSNFIQLLLHLHIIAQTKNGYFIPCALKSCNCPPPKVKLKPLLIVQCKPPEPQTLFVPKILPVPHGVFPKMIVHLMNCEEPRFLIPDSSSKGYKYRDAMSLCIFCHSDKSPHGEQIGTICINKKYKHIEIYFIGDPKHCPLVREEVINAFISSSPNAPYFVPAFMCPSKDVNCYCIITDEEGEKFNCTSCPMPATIEDGEKYLYWSWFRDPCQSSSEGGAATITKDSTMEGKGSDAVVDTDKAKSDKDVDVKKLVEELKSVTQSQYANITGLPKENLRAVADEMFTRGIIGKGVNEKPNYNAIISEFEAGLGCYETVAKVEEHCKKFLSALEAVGGSAAIKAKQLRLKWIQGVKASLINLK